MPHIARQTFEPLLFALILICVGYISAQQSPNQQRGRTQSANPAQPLQQQNDQLRDQLAQLQMQIKDLGSAIDDLKMEQQMIEARAKETHELVLDSRVVQTQDRQGLNSLVRTVGQDERKIDQLGQQVSSMMLDLRRVKTKVGLY